MGIEDRLENWSRVVRDPSWQPQYCASWARLAVAMRDAESGAPQAIVSIDVNDGWLVEHAWQKIADPIAKRLLQYHYVHRMPAEMVCHCGVSLSSQPGSHDDSFPSSDPLPSVPCAGRGCHAGWLRDRHAGPLPDHRA
ncbi:hypothetical protein R8510_03180 [Ralstonia chuxiongensis]|nr:hypothetical protein R8510_03180 [Ralstonia chuxiongensis]